MIHVDGVGFRLERVRCGKINCRSCPHGPYWYAYQQCRGKLKKTYVGKLLPIAVVNVVKSRYEHLADRLLKLCDYEGGT